MVLCSCETKKVYRPSQFPDGQSNRSYLFAIPYVENNNAIYVRVRLNGGPQFEGIWDSGCGFPLKISDLEAATLKKNGTLSESDYLGRRSVQVASGQTIEYPEYMLKAISFVDNEGIEHTLYNQPAVIDYNNETSILIGLPIMQALGYSHEISQYDKLIKFKE